MKENYVPMERLLKFQKKINKQKGQKYSCSNQIVVCGVFTNNRDVAIDFIRDKAKNKTLVYKRESEHEIEYAFNDGERWMWKRWNENCRGYRFYKLAVDWAIDEDLFNYIIRPCSSLYCCSMEII